MIWFTILGLIHAPLSAGKTSVPVVTITKGLETLVSGSVLQLNCSVSFDDGNTTTTYQWYKESLSKPLSGETSLTLTITAVSKSDTGQYYCAATSDIQRNSVGKSITVIFLESVQLAPFNSPNEGDNVSFTCSALSNMNIQYEFKKDGAIVREKLSTSTYSISQVDASHSGLYTCTAFASSLSVDSNSVSINVKELFQKPTLVAKSNWDSGEDLLLRCDLSHLPLQSITYQFFKGSSPLGTFTTATFIKTAQSTDTGSYTCTAEANGVSKVSAPVDITVALKVVMTIPSVMESQNLNIACNVQGEESVQSFSWKKNGVTFTAGSVFVVTVAMRSMIGERYSCSATSSVATSAEASKTLTKDNIFWLDKPVLSIKDGKTVVKEGDQVTLVCTAESNPLPMYAWYIGGNIMSTGSPYTFNAMRNAGSYSCKASNVIISTPKESNALDLTILYLDQPSIIFNEGGSQVTERSSVQMECQVNAYHSQLLLTYEWLKDTTGPRVQAGTNKILQLSPVKKDDAGTYTCEITGKYESVSITRSKSQNVEVYYTASQLATSPSDRFEGEVGQRTTMTCNADDFGNPPARLFWYKSGVVLVSGNAGSNVVYTIDPIKRASTNNYICKAINSAGEVAIQVSFIALDKPDEPTSLELLSTTSTSLEITWKPPVYYGNKPITSYILQYREKGDANFMSKTVTGSVKYNITELKPAVMYEIKVRAVNIIGPGKFSGLSNITTGEAIPTAPTAFGYDSISKAEEITLSWREPNPSHGLITNYTVCYVQDTDDGAKFQNSTEKCSAVGNKTQVTLNSLGFYNGYNVSVSAQNSVGYGPKAVINQIVTMEGVPTVVQNISLQSGQTTIKVTWAQPEHVYGKLHGYVVKYHLTSETIPTTVNGCVNETTLRCNINNLTPYRDYNVIVTVFNTLHSKSANGDIKTRGAAPPRINKTLPVPPSSRVEKNSFGINIVTFNEKNGKIREYDIIAMTQDNPLSAKNPQQELTNAEIKDYVVGRLINPTDNQLFIVGGGQTSKRKRRSLGPPRNPELEEDTIYVVFVRAYVDDNTYQSTDWYAPVKTDKAGPDPGTIAGIVVGILVAILLIIVIVLLVRSRNKNKDDIDLVEDQQKKKQKSFRRGPTPPSRDPRIPVAFNRFEDHVNTLKANSNYEFSQEYSMISRELDHPYTQSREQDNNIKNRYHNVPSYDDTRVMLSVMDSDPSTDYINANYIGGFDRDNEYIATQGPLPETIFDFWRMTWECEVTTIVMLTRLEEKGRVKCAQYWPESGSLSLKDIVITATEVHDFPDHVVRTFHVTRTGQAIERIVKQFHFTAWPDFGVPENPSALLAFLRKVNNWKGISQGPVIVHCSAGVGRTGTYITIDTQIKNIKKNKEITIFTNVTNIRQQRCLMVQTEDQYIFIHAALIDYLDSGDTEVDVNALREYIKKQSQVDVRTGMTGLMDEFIKLAKTDKKDKFTEANKNVNQAKNRYKNVYPYDDTRVKLSQRPGVDGSDYINANFIDSYAAKDYFIATQAPLESTIGDFWRMIWEQNCGTIVMLSKEVEGGQVKVHPYWPQKSSSKIEHFIIEITSVTTYGDHIVRDLKLTNTDASSSREVKQFQYTTWPESGSPDSGFGIIELIGQVQKWNTSINNKIITVHCSAGVGRTGVFIALTNLIERVKTEAVVDVYQTIKKMRQQRTAMVQTRDQYEFCFRALQEYLDSFDLYANFH